MVSYIHTKLPVNVIVRLPHRRSGDSQGQETFLAPSANNQTYNYDHGDMIEKEIPLFFLSEISTYLS